MIREVGPEDVCRQLFWRSNRQSTRSGVGQTAVVEEAGVILEVNLIEQVVDLEVESSTGCPGRGLGG